MFKQLLLCVLAHAVFAEEMFCPPNHNEAVLLCPGEQGCVTLPPNLHFSKDAQAARPWLPSDSFALEAWVYLNEYPARGARSRIFDAEGGGYATIDAGRTVADGLEGWGLDIDEVGRVSFSSTFYDLDEYQQLLPHHIVSIAQVPLFAWTHVTVVRDTAPPPSPHTQPPNNVNVNVNADQGMDVDTSASLLTLFINGNIDTHSLFPGKEFLFDGPRQTTYINIGCESHVDDTQTFRLRHFVNGYMSGVKLWSQVRNSTEIHQSMMERFNRTRYASTTAHGLQGWWPFASDSLDYSGLNRHGHFQPPAAVVDCREGLPTVAPEGGGMEPAVVFTIITLFCLMLLVPFLKNGGCKGQNRKNSRLEGEEPREGWFTCAKRTLLPPSSEPESIAPDQRGDVVPFPDRPSSHSRSHSHSYSHSHSCSCSLSINSEPHSSIAHMFFSGSLPSLIHGDAASHSSGLSEESLRKFSISSEPTDRLTPVTPARLPSPSPTTFDKCDEGATSPGSCQLDAFQLIRHRNVLKPALLSLLAHDHVSNNRAKSRSLLTKLRANAPPPPCPPTDMVYPPGRPFVCTYCDPPFFFKRKHNLAVHLDKHRGIKRFACSACGARFTRKQNMERHWDSKHSGEKTFVCDVCDKKFARHDSMVSHVKTHDIDDAKPFPCPNARCKKPFSTSRQLEQHATLCTLEAPRRPRRPARPQAAATQPQDQLMLFRDCGSETSLPLSPPTSPVSSLLSSPRVGLSKGEHRRASPVPPSSESSLMSFSSVSPTISSARVPSPAPAVPPVNMSPEAMSAFFSQVSQLYSHASALAQQNVLPQQHPIGGDHTAANQAQEWLRQVATFLPPQPPQQSFLQLDPASFPPPLVQIKSESPQQQSSNLFFPRPPIHEQPTTAYTQTHPVTSPSSSPPPPPPPLDASPPPPPPLPLVDDMHLSLFRHSPPEDEFLRGFGWT